MSVQSFRRRPIRPRNNADRALREMYGDRNGKVPELSRFELRGRRRLRTIFFSFLLIIAFFGGVAWAGFFVFYSSSRGGGEGVALTIAAPTDITSSDAITWTVRYKNNERVPLSKIELNLYYPQSFVFEKADPEPVDDRKTRWQLGSLGVGEEKTVAVTGSLFDTLGANAVLRAVLVYKPANFNSEFEAIASSTIAIARAPLEFEIKGPDEVSPGELVSYTVRLKNTTADALAPFRLNLNYPNGFVLEKLKPDATRDRHLWDVKKLLPDKEMTVALDGRFSGDSGERTLNASAERVLGDKNYPLAATGMKVKVSKGDMDMTLSAQGSATGGSVQRGATVPFVVKLKNTSEYTLTDIAVIVELTQSAFDWKGMTNTDKGIVDGGTVRWTKKEVRGFAKMLPSGEATLSFALAFTGQGTARGVATVNYLREGNRQKTWELKSNVVSMTSGSDFSLRSAVSYRDPDGAVVGSGPIPPKVGDNTTFRITWTLPSQAHDLDNVVVRTALAPSVQFTNRWRVSAGDLTYDSGTGSLVWRVNTFPLGGPELTAFFDVSVRPDASDAGKALPLTLKTTFEAMDRQLNSSVGGTDSPLTTAVLENETDKKSGVVVP